MTKPTMDEIISKEQFFIDLYNSQVDHATIVAFEEDVIVFYKLGIGVNFHKKYTDNGYTYFIEPFKKERGKIGYQRGKND